MSSVKRGFLVMWLFIVIVSAHDGCLVVAHRQSIVYFERNPVGQWLLGQNGGDVWLLLAVKSIGTLCVSTVLLLLYWSHPRLGWTCCAATAMFQFALLVYLYCA